MNRVLLLIITAAICIHAQTSVAQTPTRKTSATKVVLRTIGKANVSLSKGRLRRTFDLSDEVVGCSYVSGSHGALLRKRGCAATPATFKLIDSATQNGNTYLVIESEAMDNCNACGECGATEGLALIWLELDGNLRLLNKNSAHVQDCRSRIDIVRETDEARDNDDYAFAFKKNILIVEFEKRSFEANDDTVKIAHLEYNRKEPQLGFVITTKTK
jgi:hypothetical protein